MLGFHKDAWPNGRRAGPTPWLAGARSGIYGREIATRRSPTPRTSDHSGHLTPPQAIRTWSLMMVHFILEAHRQWPITTLAEADFGKCAGSWVIRLLLGSLASIPIASGACVAQDNHPALRAPNLRLPVC
ncbi:hypothetical protein [Pontibacter sp. G13]|uniref:hypothetical protein n=1 Tax=Pontibacter sp. G13 TaxID=3074898 RepID=UPI00288965D7|nr:hypothetical protein [Pontibacter sp. G13]WNJ19568.1 hypothetical protein RJD25_03685 [Pontibacter sp. G13]